MKFEMSNKPLSVFNFSSLTDIVFLLLLFFLLTSQFVIQTGVKVKLPGSKNNEQITPSRFVITLTADGKIFLGSNEVTLGTISLELSKIKSQIPGNNLIIRTDKSVVINRVIRIIDAAKGVGINKFTIETEKESF